jgi:hypothetical protein
MIPHSEVEQMISSALDHGGITSLERAELLSVLAMFGGNPIHPDPLLGAHDIAVLKSLLCGESKRAAAFSRLSKSEIKNFLYYCVRIGSAELIGFTSAKVAIGGLMPDVQQFIDHVVATDLKTAGPDYMPADSVQPEIVTRSNESFG